MKLKCIKTFFFFCTILLNIPAGNSMDPGNPGIPEDYFKTIDLDVQPPKIKIKDDLTEKSILEFEDFRKSKQELKNKKLEYMIIKSYILNILKIQHNDFSQIEECISEPVPSMTPCGMISMTPCGMMMGMGRTLFLPFDTLADLLSTKTPNPVTSADIKNYLKQTNESLKNGERFNTLKYFAIKVLQYNNMSLDDLSSSITTRLDTSPAAPCGEVLLVRDFEVILKALSRGAERNIRQEFEIFESEYEEKKERVRLREDLDAFFMQSGSKLPMKLYPIFVREVLWFNDMELPYSALPKGYDISPVLAEKSHGFFFEFLSNMQDDRFRIFERFIVCRQHNLLPENAHPEFYQHSLVSFQGDTLYQDGNILNTPGTIWALNPTGELCIFPQNKSRLLGGAQHSYFFQKDAIGLPLACGGHIEVQNGKISRISNDSGHYSPSPLQLILAVSYFHEKGVVAEDLKAEVFGMNQNLSLQDILSIADMIQLNG